MNETWMRIEWTIPGGAWLNTHMLVRESDVLARVEGLTKLGFSPSVTIEDNPAGKLSVEGVRIQS